LIKEQLLWRNKKGSGMIPPLLPRIATESLVGRKHKNKTRSDQREASSFWVIMF
jgi:hypothetical protein